MSRRFTKIICAILSAVVALGILFVAGCKEGHTDKALGGSGIFTDGKAVSNGGFAVEKGDYIYFINGVQNNSANNDYGKPVKGAISRISKTDYAAHNYSKTDIVVPQIAYSSAANHSAGIFIYGDAVYYGTPSTAKNADGAVQYQNLEMQSTKLDRSSTSAPYITFSDSSYEYRYVEAEGTVYLLYIATGEKLYDESTGVNNIHSLNTKTGKNTLLAYNISDYKFDAEDKTNPRIYYTMAVKNYASGNTESYNQVYTVTADVTEENKYDVSGLKIKGAWDDDKDHYVNCGQLVFEGIGPKVESKTPFNYKPEDKNALNKRSYQYTLKTYVNGTLVFTRSSTDINEQYLYTYKDGTIDKDGCTPITLNEKNDNGGIEEKELLKNGSGAENYRYIFDDKGNVKAVLNAESSGGISINYVKADGTLHEEKHEGGNLYESKYFNIVKEGTATILFLDTDNKFVYYSISGSGVNGYSVWRVSYASDKYEDYEEHKFAPNEYTPVQILDVDSVTDWYLPEIIDGQLIYASASSDMTLYTYIMVCDLRKADGSALMDNAELRDFNKLYKDLQDAINDTSSVDKYPVEKYQNLQNVINYGFYTQDTEYIYEHQKKVNKGFIEDDNLPLSDETIEVYLAFLKPTKDNAWSKFTDKKTVNGKEIYATNRNYYYTLLGTMTSEDKEGYKNSLISTYLPAYTEATITWWESIGTVGQVFFIIGMCLIGLIVIAGITILVIVLVKRRKKGGSAPKRRRIKVDTTDDKSIDVYNN